MISESEEDDVTYAKATMVIFCICTAIIFAFGIVGNSTTLLVILKTQLLHTKTNFYLCSLAISDILLLLLGLPFDVVYVVSSRQAFASNWFCIGRGFLSETATNASILTIVAFTLERYFAICRPFCLWASKTKICKVVIQIVIIWLIAMLAASPLAYQYGIVRYHSCACMDKFGINDANGDVIKSSFLNATIWSETADRDEGRSVLLNPIDPDSDPGAMWKFELFDDDASAEVMSSSNESSAETMEFRELLDFMSAAGDESNSTTFIFQNHSLSSSCIRKCMNKNPMTVCNTVDERRISYSFELSSILFFVLPMAFIAVFYGLIMQKLRETIEMSSSSGTTTGGSQRGSTATLNFELRRSMSSSQAHARSLVIRMLVVVVTGFFICFLPLHTQRLLTSKIAHWSSVSPASTAFLRVWYLVSGLLYYFSAAINPVIYHLFSRNFRCALWALCRRFPIRVLCKFGHSASVPANANGPSVAPRMPKHRTSSSGQRITPDFALKAGHRRQSIPSLKQL